MNWKSISMFSILCASLLFGQAAPKAPTFEVASIKPSNPDAHGETYHFAPGAGVEVVNGTLRGIIEMAYGVRDFQIQGGPNWLSSDRYDIIAKNASDDASARTLPRNERIKQSQQRLQGLLAERFQLKLHRETRDLQEYALLIGKNGAKLQEIKDLPEYGISSSCGRMTGTRTLMTGLAVYLARELGRPVVDRTGLTGKYNFQLTYTPDSGSCSRPADPSDPAAANPGDGPSIFTALQEQLGLKLESIKGPVEVIVVDHAEKADAN